MFSEREQPVASGSSSVPMKEASVNVPSIPQNLKRGRSSNDFAEASPSQSISATQAERNAEEEEGPDAPEMDELYVALRTDTVGIQHYSGLVAPQERVMLERDALNPYDGNAVKVVNARGIQVGHIPRAVAAKLAPLMDNKSITVEGEMNTGNIDGSSKFKLSIMISMYGAPSARATLEPQLVWATPGMRGFEHMRQLQAEGLLDENLQPTTAAQRKTAPKPARTDIGVAGTSHGGTGSATTALDSAMQAMLDGLKKLNDDEKQANDVMDALTSSFDVAKIPMHPAPPGIADGTLRVNLLPHQSQALQWMIEHENPQLPKTTTDAPVQFWKKAKAPGRAEYWLNAATMTPQQEDPVLGKGGIIADGMGLGKTLSTLALILATIKDKSPEHSNSTLIVCPLSVLSNWSKQIEDHVVNGRISVHVYHGDGRKITAAALATKDVVVTTYQTVAAESAVAAETAKSQAKKAKVADGPLMRVKWKRVVCDEGHVLKNPRAKMSLAMCALLADKRWVCTGTPIINSPADLGSLLQFLQVCKPLDQGQYFKSLLLRKLSAGDPSAAKLLQALIGSILLRRTKESTDERGKKLVQLPPLEFFQVSITLDEVTRKLYNDIKDESARRFRESLNSGQGGANNVLSMLVRMRQLCLSASLIPSGYLDELREPPKHTAAQAIDSLTPEERAKLIEKLRRVVAELEECPICFDVMTDPRMTTCAHSYCLECISEVLRRTALCPLDRRQLPAGSLIELPPDVEADDDFEEEKPKEKAPFMSAKVEELIKLLQMFPSTDKTLVFSQFTGFLAHVGTALDLAGISHCRFDGSMPANMRRETIARFQQPLTGSAKGSAANPQVMLISLKSGAVGLNLTAASNVFLMDPWWQTSIESQAIDRAHRMGQQKPVKVFQLIADDTIESKVLEIQARKDVLITQAFAKSTKESAQAKKAAKLEDLKEIFGLNERNRASISTSY